MKKKNKNKSIGSKNTTIQKTKSRQPFDYLIWFLKNAIAGVVAYIIIFQCIEKQLGYNWAYNTLMKENFKLIKEHSDMTLEQKLSAKFGYNYAYWKYIQDNTPEDAVILYPTKEFFFPSDKESKFTGEVFNKIYASRFLYPRKLVYPTEIETSPYGEQITHVAIANGWGYDYLEYKVDNPVADNVLPIKQTEDQINNNK